MRTLSTERCKQPMDAGDHCKTNGTSTKSRIRVLVFLLLMALIIPAIVGAQSSKLTRTDCNKNCTYSCLWGLADETGRTIVPCEYNWIEDMVDGVFVATKTDEKNLSESKYFFINEKGTVILVDCTYPYLYYKKGLGWQVSRGGKTGFINNKGQEIIPVKFGSIDGDALAGGENSAFATLDNSLVLINKTGNVVSSNLGSYKAVIAFAGEHALIQTLDGEYVFVNKKGETVLSMDYESISPIDMGLGKYSNEYFWVTLNRERGVLDTKGNVVAPFIFFYYPFMVTNGRINTSLGGGNKFDKYIIDLATGKIVRDKISDKQLKEAMSLSARAKATIETVLDASVIDYSDEAQLKALFDKLDSMVTTIKGEGGTPEEKARESYANGLRNFKFALLDHLSIIRTDISYAYEKVCYEVAANHLCTLLYEDYITRFPNGSFAADLKIKMDSAEAALYQVALNSQSQKPYLDYISRFPNGLYADEVRLKTKAMTEIQKQKLIADRAKAVKEERDDINKYVKFEAQDIFFAKGDGLTFWEWIASSSADHVKHNVFVLARVKNTGKLPKRVKATIGLKLTSEVTVRLLLSESSKRIETLTDEWYMEIAPESENALVGFFKISETAHAEGNMLLGTSARTYVDPNNAYNIRLEYYDGEISAATLTAQSDLIANLRKNGNMPVKSGYASYYAEAQAHREIARQEAEFKEKCLDCAMDTERSKTPKTKKDWFGFTVEKPGKFITQNGKSYLYYYDKDKGLRMLNYETGFGTKKVETWDELYDAFYRQCLKDNCPGYSE